MRQHYLRTVTPAILNLMRHFVYTLRCLVATVPQPRHQRPCKRNSNRQFTLRIRKTNFGHHPRSLSPLRAHHRQYIKRRRSGFFTTGTNGGISQTRILTRLHNGSLRRLITHRVPVAVVSALRIIRIRRNGRRQFTIILPLFSFVLRAFTPNHPI